MTSERRLVVIGGGPGGYEAALVAADAGVHVVLISSEGLGGAAVLTDCVPSKALIATGGYAGRTIEGAAALGIDYGRLADGGAAKVSAHSPNTWDIDLGKVNDRVIALAQNQSADIHAGLTRHGIDVISGQGALVSPAHVQARTAGGVVDLRADAVLVATGSRPRVMPTAVPDGQRILTWQQLWGLRERPQRLIVVGSGVTGAELAQAYLHLGCQVTLVSSREHVLPGEDPDAAQVLETVFRRRGMEVLARSRAAGVTSTGTGVVVELADGARIEGSHALLAVGSTPNTNGIGLEQVGVRLGERGHINVDRVSRTSVPGIYAAGDCTGVLPLASVAAMQGRIAVAHAFGDAVHPLNTMGISANIFTDPEIATVGRSEHDVADESAFRRVMLPLETNPRAKMEHITEGFVKLFTQRGTGVVVGGVVVAPRASELIYPVALAVQHRLTVDEMARTITVYPSLSGSIAEAARRLHEGVG